MKKPVLYYTCIATLLSCSNGRYLPNDIYFAKDTGKIRHVVKQEQFGDSLRIVTEKKWNVLIKHYIDLKGLTDDSFDNSFTGVCKYKRTYVDSSATIDGKNVKIKALLREHYRTEFSEGNNFYFISVAGDTLFSRHEMDWIR